MAIVVSGSPHMLWVPVETTGATVVVVGSVVSDGTDGVLSLNAAAGAFDTTGKDGTVATADIPLGVVVGLSTNPSTYSSTYKANYGTSIITSNANYTSDPNLGVEGGWGKGDKRLYAKIAAIGPDTIVRFPIFTTALGTAPTVGTVTTGSSTGVGCTTSAVTTTVANMSTAYFRSGANKGLYRITTTAHATVHTWTSPLPAAVAVGDTMLTVNLRSHGHTYFQLDATGCWIDGNAAPSTDFYGGIVTKLNLETPGKEYVDLKFGAFQFMPKLA
jgi:hypothetical protein